MEHSLLKCYRVWFVGGSAILVDARSEQEAREHGEERGTVREVECLTDEEVTKTS